MAEYIDRGALLADISAAMDYRGMGVVVGQTLMRFVKRQPAADVAPVVHGRWVHSRYSDCAEQFELVKCSICNHEAYVIAFYVRSGSFCPNCGARMDGGVDNGCE